MTLTTTDIATVSDVPLWWPDYSIGFFYFVLGIAGAMIIVFFGGWDRLMGKSARLLECEEEVRSMRKYRETLTECTERKDLEGELAKAENRLSDEIKFARGLGILLFIFVGGVFAAFFAYDMLQAIAIGAGWTGLVGAFGIKKDSDTRREVRDKKDDELLKDWKNLLAKKSDTAYETGYDAALKEVAEGLGYEVEQDNDVRRVKLKKTTGQKAETTYNKGYSDAIKRVAEEYDENIEDVLKKIGTGVEQ